MSSKPRGSQPGAASGPKARANTSGDASNHRSKSTTAQSAGSRAARSASASADPVVKRQPVAKRQMRAVRRAEQRRRRNNVLTGIAAVLVVGAIIWVLLTHLPASSANGKGKVAGNASCPATPTVVGPAPAQTPDPTPPPVSGKTVNGDQGLQYIDVSPGCGQETKAGDTVTVKYTGWLQSTGKEFDSSLSHGGTFQIPSALDSSQPQVIQGWNIGLNGMKVGATRRLIIPPSLGYGSQANGPIPANSTLIFDVTIVSIDSSGA